MKLYWKTCLVLSLFVVAASGASAADRGPGREATLAVVNPVVRSPLRTTLSLDGDWEFATDPKREGEAAEWFQPGRAWPAARKLRVPGCWEAQGVGEPGLSQTIPGIVYEPVNVKMQSTYSGAAWYRKQVTIPADWTARQVWLKVGGVNSQGWFWVNGTYLGHLWAYCGTYKYNISDLVRPGEPATIVALVRNDLPSRRGESNCVRTYGGLFRSVELDATPDILIENAYVEPRLDEKQVRLHVTLRNTTGKACAVPLAVEAVISTIKSARQVGGLNQSVTVGPGATSAFAWDVKLDEFHLWSPEDPFLYRADVTLKQSGQPVDGWSERFGIKRYEVAGGDMHLNHERFFVRCGGDDHVYPLTVCSPASREEHLKHLRVAKAYGFNYVRHHTHCEIPEFYEAADEIGILVQPELPYYGKFSEAQPYSHMSRAPLSPEQDLRELIEHYRRYTSLAIYCGGNEGLSPMPRYQELFKLAKELDPSRPWLNMDGSQNNTRENSEMNHGGYGWECARLPNNDWPFVRHEYLSFGINEDPRLEAKFKAGYAPNKSLAEVKEQVTRETGLDWKWAEACFDAGYRLQALWHKIGLEAARIDPNLDGFSFWLMLDISPSTQCGILDMFWGKKSSTPEFFRQFNAPTVILAQTTHLPTPEPLGLNPGTLIYTSSDVLEVDWVVSHFEGKRLQGAALQWKLIDGQQTLGSGQVENLDLASGTVATVGRSRIEMPAVPKATRARLVVELPDADSRNSWNVWIYPKFTPDPHGGAGVAASAEVWELLVKRYPAISKLGEPAAADAGVVVARGLTDKGVLEALKAGKRVLSLSLTQCNTLEPGVGLAAWAVSDQTGTAIANHPAWGNFPHEGYLDQGWFRLVGEAERLDAAYPFRKVEPLMVGLGRKTGYGFGTLGYPLGLNVYAFQANVGKGRLLASGLNLSTEYPEAVYLLDQLIRYVGGEQFQPTGEIEPAELSARIQEIASLRAILNGWTSTWRATEGLEWPSFVRKAPMYIVRQNNAASEVVWQTRSWQPDADGRATLRWIANLGWRSQPGGGHFSLHLGDEKLLDFDIAYDSTTWKSADGSVELRYTVKSHDKDEDSSGIMELVLPASKLPPDGQPAVLRVTGSAHNSLRYFGLQESP